MFILKKGHQPGVYVPLRALFLVGKRNLKLNLNYKPMAIILNHGQNITKCKYITIKRHA